MKDDIKLGKIRKDKLIKFSDSVTWSLDYTLLIFIRDSLKRFRELRNGIPCNLIYKYEQVGCENAEEKAREEYDNIINTIITNIEYYQTDEVDLLTDKEKEIYNNRINSMRFEKTDKSGLVSIKFDEPTAEYNKVNKKLEKIRLKQEKKLKQAFNLLRDNLTSFWW